MRKAFIDLKALEYNFWQIKKIAPHARIIAMVKSNAYGHGLIPISLALPFADAFGVACISEGIKLRQAGITQPIILMSGFYDVHALSTIDEYQFDLVVHRIAQLDQIKEYAFHYFPQIWVKINTGMNRIGVMLHEIPLVLEKLFEGNWLKKTANWMTHFANADNLSATSNFEQLNLFKKVIKDLPGEKSAANSAAIISLPEAHFDWIRPGIMLYGISPFVGKTGLDLGLKPVMRLVSKLISVYQLKAGEFIGYGSTWQSPETMPMGIISLGYGDGYPRHASMHGVMVNIQGILCPLIGRISMDFMTVDLRRCSNAQVGDTVVIWGEELPIERLASSINTIGYELVCHVSSRVEFQYE